MNFKVAEKALQFLEEEPRRFDMDDWIVSSKSARLLEGEPPCGTACCFFGAVVLSSSKEHSFLRRDEIRKMAMELLELEPEFNPSELTNILMWPYKFYLLYANAKTQSERVAALRAYVETFKSEAA